MQIREWDLVITLANCFLSSWLLFILGVKLVSGLYKDGMKLIITWISVQHFFFHESTLLLCVMRISAFSFRSRMIYQIIPITYET